MQEASPRDVRVAVVGYGYWGPNLARNFHHMTGAQLAYVVDQDATARERARQLYGCQTAMQIDDVLADPALDAVVIATPARTHHALARRALAAGKHVLVEKPLTMDVSEAEDLVTLAKQSGLTLMVGTSSMSSIAVSLGSFIISTAGVSTWVVYKAMSMRYGALHPTISR